LTAVPCTELTLAAGDRLLFYTDGVTDRETPSGDAYDITRLGAALASCGDQSAEGAVTYLVADIESFAQGHEPQDDITLLLIDVR
jgi:sigma-B regulation protein RsbU (phosphoserine phosphatase)